VAHAGAAAGWVLLLLVNECVVIVCRDVCRRRHKQLLCLTPTPHAQVSCVERVMLLLTRFCMCLCCFLLATCRASHVVSMSYFVSCVQEWACAKLLRKSCDAITLRLTHDACLSHAYRRVNAHHTDARARWFTAGIPACALHRKLRMNGYVRLSRISASAESSCASCDI